MIAAIALAHIAGPEAKQNSQIASGARSRDQAGKVFKLARHMVEQSPMLLERVRIVPSGKRLIGLSKNVEYEALSAEASTAFGASLALAILDEVGQIKGPTDEFVTAITSSQGAYENPLLIAISTQAPTDNDMFSVWIDAQRSATDPRIVSHVYEAPKDCALDDRAAWYAANPALGIFKAVSDMESKSSNAMRMPANEPSFRNLDLNQRVEKTNPFVSRTVWEDNGAAPGDIDGRRIYGGLDLASVRDLAAFVAVDEDGGVHPTFWLPEQGLAEKSRKEHVPYDLWKAQGFLQTSPGRAVEFEFIAEFLRGVFDRCDVVKIGFDRALMRFLVPWLEKAEFTAEELSKFVEFGQGTLSMTPALRELEVKLLNRQLRHGKHPVLAMCAANAITVGDSGARKFDKARARGRIDGMTALANAIGVMPVAETKPDYAVYFV